MDLSSIAEKYGETLPMKPNLKRDLDRGSDRDNGTAQNKKYHRGASQHRIRGLSIFTRIYKTTWRWTLSNAKNLFLIKNNLF